MSDGAEVPAEGAVDSLDQMAFTLRALRKLRGWTQQDLALHAGRGASLSTIRQVERGAQRPTWSFTAAVAGALNVDPFALLGAESPTASQGPARAIEAALPEIRRAVATYDCPMEPQMPPRGLHELADAVDAACRMRLEARYGQLAGVIAPLIEEVGYAAQTFSGQEREKAFWLLSAAYRCADALVYKSGHLDLSATVVERIGWAAARSGDPLMVATAVYVRAQSFFDTDAAAAGLRLITRAAEPLALDAAVDARAASVYGALHARAAVLSAKSGDSAGAEGHLKIARGAAAVLGRDSSLLYTYFGPSQLRIHELAAHVELGDGPGALAAASNWQLPTDLPAERSSHFLIDLARAQVWVGACAAALASLLEARRLAPQHT
ncbi:MAG TPA: helix-turn-helix transcriptional regulator, partial [Polyangiaceae bacterium]